MKRIIFTTIMLCIFHQMFAQLTINANNDAYLPAGKSYWIGASSDAGKRFRLHHDGNNAYLDYATNMYIRNGSGTSLLNICSFVANASSYPWLFSNVSGDPCLFASNNWGIIGNASAPLYQVHTNNLYCRGVLVTSDERLKTNIKEVTGCLNKIHSVKGVSYDLKLNFIVPDLQTSKMDNTRDTTINTLLQKAESDKRNREIENENKNRIGFIAQDLQKVFPELVKQDSITGAYRVDYIGMIPVLTNALNEQQLIIDKQSEQLKTQSREIEELKKAFNEILTKR